MAKVVRYLNIQQKEFCKTLTGLCERKPSWQVWTDFLECSAISIANCTDQSGEIHDKREQQYLRILHGYPEKERYGLASLMGYVIDALEENPEQDFLGDMYMALELNSHWHGQFFTPYHVSQLLAKVSISKGDETLRRRGWICVNDPACGAGSLLIAARNACLSEGIGYRQVLYTAQDVDRIVALMCYIQLSLLGCAGYVVVGDSLLHPLTTMGNTLIPIPSEHHEIWYTPLYCDEVWQGRIRWAMLDQILQGTCSRQVPANNSVRLVTAQPTKRIKSEPEPTPENLIEQQSELLADQSGQLRIF